MENKIVACIAGIALFLLLPFICPGCKSKVETPPPPSNPSVDNQGSSPVSIYYGLNESHSTDWVQGTDDGTVGIVYFQVDTTDATQDSTNNDRSGSLIYKTILPDGTENMETVADGNGLEISVLLYDSENSPHIFTALSTNDSQLIYHYYKNSDAAWISEKIDLISGGGGLFIYELSAKKGKDGTFHLLAMKIRSNPDSDDYYFACFDCYLYHLTNASGSWQKELINTFDSYYCLSGDYVKALRRQDMAVDNDGYVHVVYGEMVNAPYSLVDLVPSRLCYTNNKSGSWEIEYVVEPEGCIRCDPGWSPSLALDSSGSPVVAATFVDRVPTGSARSAWLRLSHRIGKNNWKTSVIADSDDGYYGTDGRDYTGAMPHLLVDDQNHYHIVFSDIASSHWRLNFLNVGQIRYAFYNGSSWNIRTIYTQPNPSSYFVATEMGGQCMVLLQNGEKIKVVGQELISWKENDYRYSLVQLDIK